MVCRNRAICLCATVPARRHSTLERGVRHDETFVKEQLDPKTVTRRACAKRSVERKQARLDFWDRKAGHRTGKVLGKGRRSGSPSVGAVSDMRNTICKIERRAETIGETGL